EINFEVPDKQGAMKHLGEHYSDGEVDWLDGITVQYDEWWFNVRPSNTEPLLRLNLEAETAKLRDEKRRDVTGVIEQYVSS
ncbi:MAG: phosphomannomutase/phosphoglucomutase, partial [bacterium]